MSLSVIGAISSAASQPQLQQAAPAPTPAQPTSTAPQNDTVTISAAGQKAAQGGDHDGDST